MRPDAGGRHHGGVSPRDRNGRAARTSAILFALITLGSSSAQAQPTERTLPERQADHAEVEALVARIVTAWRGGDLAPLRALLGARVRIHDLDFDDPACRRRFGKDREVRRGEIKKLAGCLGSLRLQLSNTPSNVIEPFDERYAVFHEGTPRHLELGIDRVRGILRVTRFYLFVPGH